MTRRGTISRPSALAIVSLRPMGFEVADDDVDALGAKCLRLVEHAVGLADAGGVAQVDLETGRGAFMSVPRVGEEADVEIFGRVDQLLDGTAVALRVAEEELRDALLMRELEQGLREIAALQAMHLRADFARQGQMLVQTGPVGGVQAGLFHVGGQQRAVESPGVALPAFEHGAGVAARRQADEDALLGAPAYGDAVRVQVLLQLPVHDVGGQQERQLAQFGEHAGVAHGDIGRGIDHFDFIGFVQELLGDAGERRAFR